MSSIFVKRRQRMSMRRSVRVECQAVREHDFRLVGHRAVDLSLDGMLLLSEARVLTGEELVISFRAPMTKLWLDCTATVARVVHGRRPNDWGTCLGVSFEAMDDATRALLRKELRGLPPPMPARTARIDYAATVRRVAFGS
jgi:hypothetical protein